MSATVALEIVGVFAVMFVGIVVATLWFAHSHSKLQNRKELQEKKLEIYDKHFSEMVRIECPYCKTLFSSKISNCPNCGADTKKITFPDIPE
jgi:hypothetical protein